MANPQFKVTITHNGDDTDYINDLFSTVEVRKRECNYDVATLTCVDSFWSLYKTEIDVLDEIKIWLKESPSVSWTTNPQFGGHIRQLFPNISIEGGRIFQLACKGYGAALEETHCNRDYGTESANPSYPKSWNIWKNVIEHFVNHSFAGDPTNYEIDHANVSDYVDTNITYINNPYRANIEVIDLVCDIATAIENGSAGPHWIVDTFTQETPVPIKGRFLLGKIGDHAAGGDNPLAYWPNWWNTNEAESTFTEGVDDLSDFQILDKSEEFANHVVLVSDLRKPPYDIWTEGNTTQINTTWTAVDATLTGDANCKVGATALKIEPTEVDAPGYAYFSGVHWNIEKFGSAKSIPFSNFYCYKPEGLDENNTTIRLFTTSYSSNYFETTFANINTLSGGDPDNEWLHKTIPVGSYYVNAETTQKYRWTKVGDAADWANINGICFRVAALTYLMVDDLHFTGKVIRSATDSHSIAPYDPEENPTGKGMELQKVLISRVSMDDMCSDDPDIGDLGFAARIAKAELFRRRALPYTVSFTVPLKKQMMAGQKCKVNALKLSPSGYSITDIMRILEARHSITLNSGATTSVLATSDLVNSRPISVPDQYAIVMENTLVNSKEAKDMRAGGEVDLLVERFIKDYPS